VNCIVVKDLSRLGRNYIEVGDYLERVLPGLGVRVIAVNDGYDSLTLTGSGHIVLGLRNLVNDIYSKDISRKICAALRVKQSNGDFIGSAAAYGFLKDVHNRNRLIINPETAPVVKQIFEWKAAGIGNIEICRLLEAQGVPSPGKYKFIKGIYKSPRFADSTWIPETIARILRHSVYLGHMKQGGGEIVVRDTHEAIITTELFDKVSSGVMA
jgi:DNA invertase Pin-like site-specific DNA recombinase